MERANALCAVRIECMHTHPPQATCRSVTAVCNCIYSRTVTSCRLVVEKRCRQVGERIARVLPHVRPTANDMMRCDNRGVVCGVMCIHVHHQWPGHTLFTCTTHPQSMCYHRGGKLPVLHYLHSQCWLPHIPAVLKFCFRYLYWCYTRVARCWCSRTCGVSLHNSVSGHARRGVLILSECPIKHNNNRPWPHMKILLDYDVEN